MNRTESLLKGLLCAFIISLAVLILSFFYVQYCYVKHEFAILDYAVETYSQAETIETISPEN